MKTTSKVTLLFVLTSASVSGVEAGGALVEGWEKAELQPIECHLKFIDQNGLAVASAGIDGAIVNKEPGNTGATERPLQFKTDENGLLNVNDETGGRLWLRVTDPAYAGGSTSDFDKGGISLNYSKNASPEQEGYGNPDKPRIIRVWKRLGPQPLHQLEGKVRIPYQGRAFSIDLVTGKILATGGDIIVAITQPTDGPGRTAASAAAGATMQHLGIFPWSCQISVNDGFFYEVDETELQRNIWGYSSTNQPIKEKSFEFSDKGTTLETCLVFQSRNGSVHGKLKLYVDSGRTRLNGDIVVRVTQAEINDTGSPSFEPDPKRLTKLTLSNGLSEEPRPDNNK